VVAEISGKTSFNTKAFKRFCSRKTSSVPTPLFRATVSVTLARIGRQNTFAVGAGCWILAMAILSAALRTCLFLAEGAEPTIEILCASRAANTHRLVAVTGVVARTSQQARTIDT
jgi:hypothetical protein